MTTCETNLNSYTEREQLVRFRRKAAIEVGQRLSRTFKLFREEKALSIIQVFYGGAFTENDNFLLGENEKANNF